MLDQHRNWFKGLETAIAKIFAELPLTPNQYTALSIVFGIAMLYFMVIGNFWLTSLFFIISAGMDFVDGGVARLKNLSSSKGAYWDTVADRYVEAIFLFGLTMVELPELYLSANAWIFLLLVGAMMTTYVKAAAKEKGLRDAELKGGLMSRAERFISYGVLLAFLIGGLNQWAVMTIALLAVLSNLTAIQRISMALRSKK
jgi:phosphatidylglycerophosphate synthase